jgi:hypothetical protein
MSERSWARALLGREVWATFAFLLAVYCLPNLLFDTELLYGASPAAPVWEASMGLAGAVGCRTFACIPLMALIFLGYTYLLSVIVATLVRVCFGAYRGEV